MGEEGKDGGREEEWRGEERRGVGREREGGTNGWKERKGERWRDIEVREWRIEREGGRGEEAHKDSHSTC